MLKYSPVWKCMPASQDVNLSDRRRSRHSAHPAQLMSITPSPVPVLALKNITVQSTALCCSSSPEWLALVIFLFDENTWRSETKTKSKTVTKLNKNVLGPIISQTCFLLKNQSTWRPAEHIIGHFRDDLSNQWLDWWRNPGLFNQFLTDTSKPHLTLTK